MRRSRRFLENSSQRGLHVFVTALVGPPLGAIVLFMPFVSKSLSAAGSLSLFAKPSFYFAAFLYSYVFGVVPAVFSAALSVVLSKKTHLFTPHLLMAPVFGFIATTVSVLFLVLATELKWRQASSPSALGMIGLVGAAAAFGSTLISYGLGGRIAEAGESSER